MSNSQLSRELGFQFKNEEAGERDLLSLLPEAVKEAALSIPEECLTKGENELLAYLQTQGAKVALVDHRLRVSFWGEYAAAQLRHRPIRASYIFSGICSRQYFYEAILKNPLRMAWLLCQPVDYTKALDEILHKGLEELRAVLAMDNRLQGKPNTPLIMAKLEIVKFVDMRVKGSIVQRQMHLHASTKEIKARIGDVPESMEELDAQLKELEEKARGKDAPIIEIDKEPIPE